MSRRQVAGVEARRMSEIQNQKTRASVSVECGQGPPGPLGGVIGRRASPSYVRPSVWARGPALLGAAAGERGSQGDRRSGLQRAVMTRGEACCLWPVEGCLSPRRHDGLIKPDGQSPYLWASGRAGRVGALCGPRGTTRVYVHGRERDAEAGQSSMLLLRAAVASGERQPSALQYQGWPTFTGTPIRGTPAQGCSLHLSRHPRF